VVQFKKIYKKKIFEITTPQGEVLLVDSLMECVNIVGVTRGTLHSALGGGKLIKLNLV